MDYIAHGYIQPPRCKTPEKVASEYFDELNKRSLIEADLVLQNFVEPDMRSLDEPSHEKKLRLLRTSQFCHLNDLGCMI